MHIICMWRWRGCCEQMGQWKLCCGLMTWYLGDVTLSWPEQGVPSILLLIQQLILLSVLLLPFTLTTTTTPFAIYLLHLILLRLLLSSSFYEDRTFKYDVIHVNHSHKREVDRKQTVVTGKHKVYSKRKKLVSVNKIEKAISILKKI